MVSGSNFRPCPCGSTLHSTWVHDARGIALCRTCVRCHTRKMAGIRADILARPNYEADEYIEPEDY
jgi:hypothetical protein